MRADLHTHSACSDGTDSPAELVRAAREAALDVLALTDHDTTLGWDEAAECAGPQGIELIRAVEVSTQVRGMSVHLLGYLFDPTHAELMQELDHARRSRQTRARKMVELLGQDLDIGYDDVLAVTRPGTTVGRPHIADALIGNGLVASREEAFAKYLHPGGPYYLTHYAPQAAHLVELVAAAGGSTVLAHPFAGWRGRTEADQDVADLADAGLFGLEAYHRDHRREDVRRALEVANRLGLAVTGSSDYHGSGKPNRLGENLTDQAVVRAIQERSSGVPVTGS